MGLSEVLSRRRIRMRGYSLDATRCPYSRPRADLAKGNSAAGVARHWPAPPAGRLPPAGTGEGRPTWRIVAGNGRGAPQDTAAKSAVGAVWLLPPGLIPPPFGRSA